MKYSFIFFLIVWYYWKYLPLWQTIRRFFLSTFTILIHFIVENIFLFEQEFNPIISRNIWDQMKLHFFHCLIVHFIIVNTFSSPNFQLNPFFQVNLIRQKNVGLIFRQTKFFVKKKFSSPTKNFVTFFCPIR